MDAFSRLVTGRRSWVVAVLVILLSGLAIGLVGSNDSASSGPSSLPSSAESARASELLAEFPGADVASAIVVVDRADGTALTPDDLAAVEQTRFRMLAVDRQVPDTTDLSPVVTAPDGVVALASVPISASLDGTNLADVVTELRGAAATDLPETLRANVTGGPAFGADIANSFAGADIRLLAITAAVVALLLIVTYRSPVLWLLPLLTVGIGDRVASTVGTAVADLTGLSFDGSTSGITSVLVFGAGTNYALLLVSRYREELRHEADHRAALRTAVRRAGPAILASNATVVLALLTLALGILPSTRSLGVLAACGLVVAAVYVLLVLPPLLALCGTRVFWPFVPRVGDDVRESVWHRVASFVSTRPVQVSVTAIVALGVCAAGLFGTQIGLSQTEQFRVDAQSVDGFEVLSQHFPAGASDPTVVVADTAATEPVTQALESVDGVRSVTRTADSPTGLSQWSVILEAAPASDDASATVESLRASLAGIDGALVGGSDAEALDTSDAAARDRLVIVPLILLVVTLVLVALLRAVVAPLVLVATTVLSSLAALGLGSWTSTHVFGFPAFDDNVPLFAFLFLVALGVDYTIFLVSRAREETPRHGTADGIVRAVSATGAVITSAGIVLAAVFCVLGVLPLITLTQLGIVVGLGILLDTFVVRTVVVPALFTLVGPRVWWPSELSRESEAQYEPIEEKR